MEKIEATLDLTGCRHLGELHRRIREALDFPAHYGGNWDAFRDCLRGDCPVTHLRILGEESMPKGLFDQLETMHSILRAHKESCGSYAGFEFEIIR